MLARLLLASALVAVPLALGGKTRAAVHASYSKLDTTVTMSDGVKLAVTYYEPAGTPPPGGWPAVMMFHGLGQTRNSFDLNTWSANKVAERYLAPQGYAVLTFDARAHGQSGGLSSLDGPRELADTRELFDWLTAHPNVSPQKVGAFGVSYGGGMVLLAAVNGVRFAAIVTAATWTDLRQALMPQGLIRAGVIVGLQQDIPPSRYAPGLFDLLREATSEQDPPQLQAFFAERSTRPRLGSLTIPTLMLQGRRDFAFDADQAIAAFRLLKGPKRLYLGDLGRNLSEARDPLSIRIPLPRSTISRSSRAPGSTASSKEQAVPRRRRSSSPLIPGRGRPLRTTACRLQGSCGSRRARPGR